MNTDEHAILASYKKQVLILGILFLIILALSIVLFPSRIWSPLDQSLSLDYPVYAHKAPTDQLFVIDSSSRRIVNFSLDGSLDFVVHGGSRSDTSFFYVREIAGLADGSFFILNNRLDAQGFYLTHEEIQLYSPQGQFIRTVYRKEYTEEDFGPLLVQRGRIWDIQVVEEVLYWYEIDGQGIRNYQMAIDTDTPVLINQMTFPSADMHIASIFRVNKNQFLAVLKDSSIGIGNFSAMEVHLDQIPPITLEPSPNLQAYVPNLESFRIFYRYTKPEGAFLGPIPWSIGLTPSGVVFTDLENQSVQLLNQTGQLREVINTAIISEVIQQDLYPYFYYTLTARADGTVITTNDEGVVVLEPDGTISFIEAANYTTTQLILSWLFFGTIVLLIFLGFFLGKAIFYGLMGGTLSPFVVRAVGLATLILIVGTLSSLIIIPNFSERYQTIVLQKISQMLQIIPQIIEADDLAILTNPEDYNSPEYLAIRENLIIAFNNNQDEWNRGYYFALYRIKNERLYGFMYMNGQINPFYPFDWLGGEEAPGVYDLAWRGEIATELITDISGDWIYGVGPIFNQDGVVVGLFETGTDLYALEYANQLLIRNLILELFVILIVIILLVVELTFFAHLFQARRLGEISQPNLAQFNKRSTDLVTTFNPSLFTRPIAYLFFTGLSLSVAFLPILSNRLFIEGGLQGSNVLVALPLAIETFGFGIATLLAGFLTAKLSWQGLFYGGTVLAAAGLWSSGTAMNLETLTIARAIVGFGSGLGYMGLRSIISKEQDVNRRTEAFSNFYAGMTAGVNTGLVIGASLADVIGLQQVFFVAVGIMAFTFLLPLLINLPKLLPNQMRAADDVPKFRDILVFVSNPRIWVFFISIILPTYIAGAYIGYFFPLFAESFGISTADIGRLLILNGLCIVYFGPGLSSFMERKFGNVSGSIIGSFFWAIGLLIAGLSGSMVGAIIAIMIMGLTEGFAVNAQNNVFLTFPSVKKVGVDQAIGIYELMGKFGETLGPIIFGASLLLGATFGLSLIAIVVAVFALFLPFALSKAKSSSTKIEVTE